MLVQELMTAPVVTVSPGATVKDAAELLVSRRVTAVPVVDAAGRLVGVVSELDLIRREVAPDPRAHMCRVVPPTAPPPRTVADVMTRDVVAVPVGTDVADVVATMVRTGYKSVPVVEDDRPVGVVSRRDVLRVLTRDDDLIAAEIARRSAEQGLGAVAVRVRDGSATLTASGGADPALLAAAALTVPGVVRVEVVAAGGGAEG